MKRITSFMLAAVAVLGIALFLFLFYRTGIDGKVYIAVQTAPAEAKAVPFARVQIRQANTLIATLNTDERGEFVARLDPGIYEITVDADGFLAASFSNQHVRRFHRIELLVSLQALTPNASSAAPLAVDSAFALPKRGPNDVWRSKKNALTGTPHRVVGSAIALPQAPQNKEQAATLAHAFLRDFVADNAPNDSALAKLELNTLEAEPVRKFKEKWLVVFTQRVKNPFGEGELPVFGAAANVTISGREVIQFGLDLFPEIKVATTAPPMSKAEAMASLQRETTAQRADTANVQLVIFPIPQSGAGKRFEYVPAYQINVITPASDTSVPFEAWRYVIDAATGRTLFRENRGVLQLQTSGRVQAAIYTKSPEESRAVTAAMSSGQIGNEQTGFQNLDALGGFRFGGATVLRELTVRPSNAHFSLFDSDFLDLLWLTWFGELPMHELARMPLSDAKVQINSSGGIDEVTIGLDVRPNSLHHLNRAREFFLARGGDDWLDTRLKVGFAPGFANAFYSSANEQLVFGSVVEPLGLRSDVIYHEYTHGVVNWMVNRGNAAGPLALPYQDEAGAMHEGLADFFACALNNDSEMRIAPPEHPIGKELNRNLDNQLTYEKDLQIGAKDHGYVHDNSRIFSGILWDLRAALMQKMGAEKGAVYAEELVLEALSLGPASTTFADFSINLLLANDNDNRLYTGTPNFAEIQAAYAKRGLVLVPFEFNRPTIQNFTFTSKPFSPPGHIEEGREVTLSGDIVESGYGLNLNSIVLELNGEKVDPGKLVLEGTKQRTRLRYRLKGPVRGKAFGNVLTGKLSIQDLAGNVTVIEISKPLQDTIKPEYELVKMAREGNDVAVVIRLRDFGSGVNPKSFVVRLDGKDVHGIQQERVNDHEYLLSLKYPCNTPAQMLYAEAADNAGNVLAETQPVSVLRACYSICVLSGGGVFWAVLLMKRRREVGAPSESKTEIKT